MIARLFLLFTVLPFVELYLLIKLWQATSTLTTIFVILATGVVGVFTARVQGWLVWQKIHLDLHHGRLPADGLIEAIVLAAAGLLLITPGLLTDGVGFALLVPSARRSVREWVKRKFRDMIERGQGQVVIMRGGAVDVEHEEIGDGPDEQ